MLRVFASPSRSCKMLLEERYIVQIFSLDLEMWSRKFFHLLERLFECSNGQYIGGGSFGRGWSESGSLTMKALLGITVLKPTALGFTENATSTFVSLITWTEQKPTKRNSAWTTSNARIKFRHQKEMSTNSRWRSDLHACTATGSSHSSLDAVA